MRTTKSRIRLAALVALLAASGVVAAPVSRHEGERAVPRRGSVDVDASTIEAGGRSVAGLGFRSGTAAELGDAGEGFSVALPPLADGVTAVRAGRVAATLVVERAAPAPAEIGRGTVTYREMFEGVDSTHVLDPVRAEEYLLLKSPASETSFTYAFAWDAGVRFEPLADGGLRFTSADDRDPGTALAVERPYLIDARGTRSDKAVRYELVDAGERFARVRLVVDTTGLAFPVTVDPTWTATGGMVTTRQQHAATVLSNGRVLVTGGKNDTSAALASAEVFVPSTGTWSATSGPLAAARKQHTAVLLQSGKVLVSGGVGATGQPLASCELYDPTTKTFSATGSMHFPRYLHTATVLATGQVVVVGGFTTGGGIFNSVERYEPGTGTWTTLGSAFNVRADHTATLLPAGTQNAGSILLTYGGSGGLGQQINTVELYNPTTQVGTVVGGIGARWHHAAVLLGDGRVLIVGGSTTGGATGSTEIFDPATASLSNGPALVTPRTALGAVLLGNGKVLVAGGYTSANAAIGSAELWDPAGAFNFALTSDAMVKARGDFTLVRVPQSASYAFTVVAAGGFNQTNGTLKATETR